MTTTTVFSRDLLAGPIQFMIGYTDMFMKDIDEAKFADRLGTTINQLS